MKACLNKLRGTVVKAPIETFILVVTVGAVVFILTIGNKLNADTKYTDILSFAVFAITLAALIYYARDTHRIADLTEKKWTLEIQPRGLLYSMDKDPAQPDSGRTIFSLMNLSDAILETKVQCNFRIYGALVESPDPAFNGERVWPVYPHQVSRSYFEIEPMLRAKGKSITETKKKRTQDNYQTQLTMDLEIEFKNELEQVRRLPARHHFFDFASGMWVPEVAVRQRLL